MTQMVKSNVVSESIQQTPLPDTHMLMFRGDTCTFTLSLSSPYTGKAYLRTNLGQAQVSRKEMIQEVCKGTPPVGRAWYDKPMRQIDPHRFQTTLPLCEVGHFEAKSYFLKDNDSTPIWPVGGNTIINVTSANTCCANIIYNTFVRQFGSSKGERRAPNDFQLGIIALLDKAGYNVIPSSGTFRDLIKELDFIIKQLGCRFLQLLPIHPTPTTYARMGRYGSPYAAISYTDVDPALAEFDPKATPVEQFTELVDAVHARGAKIILDIPINHTGWAAKLHESHPEWLMRDSEGRIEMPGAWGVIWADLTRLNYSHRELWQYMADVFLLWCRRGADGFRCDAGYMIPVDAWRFIVASVRYQYPDTVFFLEGLGGKISVTRDILNTANFDWAYSELFQNYDQQQINTYLPGAFSVSDQDGIMVHFAETHDNNRLADRSIPYARMRTALCALCSSHGAFGFAGGVEWYATKKINVHDATSLNWGSPVNQIDHIRRINTILKYHPTFHDQTELKLIDVKDGNQLLLQRHHRPTGKRLMVLANLDDKRPANGNWSSADIGGDRILEYIDLLTEKTVKITASRGRQTCPMAAGEVLCLTADMEDMDRIRTLTSEDLIAPRRVIWQRLKAKVLDIYTFYHGCEDVSSWNVEDAATQLEKDPIAFCRSINSQSEESRVILWEWPKDRTREVMIPPGHFLMVVARSPFRACLMDNETTLAVEESLPGENGLFFGLFSPLPPPKQHCQYLLKLSVYDSSTTHHSTTSVFYLSHSQNGQIKQVFHRHDLLKNPLLFMGTNGRGGMLRAHIDWGKINSRYDGILAANLHPSFPENRWIMFSRCRAWLIFQGFSQPIGINCLDSFWFDYSSRGFWRFQIPTGQGEHVLITAMLEMIPEKNEIRLTWYRHRSHDHSRYLADEKPVMFILRPDIEDRDFHVITKAYMGAEEKWPSRVTFEKDGFTFSPHENRHLSLNIQPGQFTYEPEWQYMVHRFNDKERGFDGDSDLFSPGYFSSSIKGGETACLMAEVTQTLDKKTKMIPLSHPNSSIMDHHTPSELPLEQALSKAIEQYLVQRDHLKTVIAGYPWFLDWGRDAIIFTRGLIAAGKTTDAREILIQFGQYEKAGTLPNMICGHDMLNRDTSDAPLWFFVACDDLIRSEGNSSFLEERCGNKTIREVLLSIGHSYLKGTKNGIGLDKGSGLIFSPAHFTWMDTNHPAGSPRQGYPIEIQALWYFALGVLSRVDTKRQTKKWQMLANQVEESIKTFYVIKGERFLSDCLHTHDNIPAAKAVPDDALRPNQLLAITLGGLSDPYLCRDVVESCMCLLVPGGIRSLADRPVKYPLEIRHQQHLLIDPFSPYQGKYMGDEDTCRKPAYHNGTAWTWIFPVFCEAWSNAFGPSAKETAMNWLASSTRIINEGCLGHIPEILDGNSPHTQRGCDAQAWGASELLRVWKLLSSL